MIRKLFCFLALSAAASVTDASVYKTSTAFACHEFVMPAPNDGTYTRTNVSVTIYTESGHCKGSFAVYLHHGMRYISFNNTWICIQGKSRFSYNGNWYVIK